MNIETRIDREKRLRTHVLRGAIKLSDIQDFLDKLYLTEGFNPTHHALWDIREADLTAVGPAEVKELAYFIRTTWAEKYRRKVVVVVSSDVQFGLSRMLEQFIGLFAQDKIRTFRDCQTAINWLEPQSVDLSHARSG